ncbi:MAG: DUF120 domain-containing protein [Candidatus Nanohaloarchaea archaeon]|nr:DUF120 domain-containing protein [Candidatus Nanohaloarchaea archaeon]
MPEYQERFEEALDFSPFPGTLNLVVDEREKEELEANVTSERIEGFERDGEEFSAVEAFPVHLEGTEAALLEMEVTDHPPEVAEFIAPVNLREELGLEDSDTIHVRPR